MPFRRPSSLAFVLAALGGTWTGCNGSAPNDTVILGEDAGDDAGDATVAPDTFECNPCFEVCACTPGATMFSPGSCTTFTCGADGLWGGKGCLGLGCVDADEDDAPDGAAITADASDGALDAGRDAPGSASDAASDATDGATDATEDVTADVPTDGTADE